MSAFAIVLYGAGQLGMMMLTRYFFQWIIRFADTGKDSAHGALFTASLVGALFFFFRIFDAAIDPLTGSLGDRWVASGRERRSMLWLAFLLPAVGLVMVFAPSFDMPHFLRWLLLFSGMTLFFVGYSLYAIPYWSLLEDYSRGDEGTRIVLSNTLGAGVLLATGVGFIVSPMLVDRFGFLSGAIIFGLIGTLLMALPYFASPPGVVAHKAKELPGMWRSLAASLRHSRFLSVVLLFAGAHMSLTVMTSAAPYIAERLLGGTLKDVALLLGPFLGTAVPTFILVPRFSRKYGWERATLVGAIVLSVAYLGAGLLGRGIVGTPMTTAMLVFAVAGPGSAFVLGLEGEAVAGCAARSSYKSTGMYFGVFNLVVQTMNGLALFLTGILAEINTKWAVRAMPMMAGGMCVFGIIIYFLSNKTDPDVSTSSEIPLHS